MLRIEINIHRDAPALEAEWLRFQDHAAGTFFQTYQWCSAWLDTAGAAQNATALIVTGHDPSGELLFLLPFCVRRRQGCRVLEWMGGQQMTYGYGLFDHRFLHRAPVWFATEGWAILSRLNEVDAIDLAEMPAAWQGHEHPLQSWFSLAGPNSSYVLKLDGDYETVYARKRSGETRRGNRKRDAKLSKAAKIDIGVPRDRDHAHQLIERMFEQQRCRLAESGIHGVFNAHERQFMHRLIDLPDRMQPVLLPCYMMADGELEAVALGGLHGGGFWALISSLGSPRLRRYSPGDALLRRTIEICCGRGLKFFDFSSGSFDYKLAWADEEIRLHYAVRGLTWRGYVWALIRALRLAAKRFVKRTPILWSAVLKIRRRLFSKATQSLSRFDRI
ncbi:MAG TPA: GNAT family N-acetyltransferase [Nordella sp.]|nr:GNAT family N-acetyltransferase [Nordella sp.]